MYVLRRVIHTGQVSLATQAFSPLVSLSPISFTKKYKKYTNDAASREEMPAGSKEVTTTVSSLRIDNIASAGLNISRRSIWELFMEGRVNLNGRKAEKKSVLVKVGDVIDVDSTVVVVRGDRGSDSKEKATRKGRVIVRDIGEPTKKGRWKVTLLRHKNFRTTFKTAS